MLSSCASCFEVYPTSGTCPQCRSEGRVCTDKRFVLLLVRPFVNVGVVGSAAQCKMKFLADIAAVWLLVVVILISYQS